LLDRKKEGEYNKHMNECSYVHTKNQIQRIIISLYFGGKTIMQNETCAQTDKGSCDCSGAFSKNSLLEDSQKQDREIRTMKTIVLAGGFLYAIAFVFDIFGGLSEQILLPMFLASYAVLGFPVLYKAAANIRKGKIFDENFLMSVATLGALAIGQWSEAVAVMLFYQVGDLFQKTAVHRSKRSIQELLKIRPDYANVQKGDELLQVCPDSVDVGDMIVVKPGEKIPLDGIVQAGSSLLDTAAITGESALREVEPGDTVLSGCINRDGVLTIRVTSIFGESTVSKIIEMVTNAGSRKTKSENFISRFARVYTPVVVGSAVLLAFVPPLFFGGDLSSWIYRAMSFLVISCPCALVISVPLGYFGGIGAASRRGILIKGSHFLDALREADEIVFDKTGTLTVGVFAVTETVAEEHTSKEDLLRLAYIAEAYSDHPIALSVRKEALERNVTASFPEPSAYREKAGRGVYVATDEGDLRAGNRKWMLEEGISDVPPTKDSGTMLYVAIGNRFAGYLRMEDQVRPEAAKAISMLNSLRVHKLSILTGDHEPAANKVAAELGIKNTFSDLLPSQKLEKIEDRMKNRSGTKSNGTLIFVGDGINDAPVLARADVGIAMGAMASGAAIEAADVVIMTDDLTALPSVIQIARKTRRIVVENIIFALTVKGLILVLAALGLTNLWVAIFADVGVSVLAILNALRAGRHTA
jgi:Cd2+/Zn2+-exporting ATPase